VVASKVFYHLEELDDALKYALGAGQLFDVAQKSEYVETLVAKCIDEYIRIRVLKTTNSAAGGENAVGVATGAVEEKSGDAVTATASSSSTTASLVSIDPRLEAIVERMFERCYHDGKYKQALGIALESRRLDHVSRAITTAPNPAEMLSYAFHLSQTVIIHRQFRQQLLRQLVDLYTKLPTPDYLNVCQCLLFLNDSVGVANILDQLIKKGGDEALLAYQIGFDLGENQNQPFMNQVAAALPPIGLPTADATANSSSSTAPSNSSSNPAPSASSDSSSSSSSSASSSASIFDDEIDETYSGRMRRLRFILSGEAATNIYLHFLYERSATDFNILKQIKEKLEARNSVTHNATVMAHAIFQCGTTVDVFLRDNLEWLGRAQNWAKFTATASLGVIHKAHHKESLKLLQPYLPAAGVSGSPYQEGGALYALGLIHSNHGSADKITFLTDALRNAGSNEIVQHGACLGLGLAALATGSDSLFDQLKSVMMQDSAVAGEAAGLSMGLVLCGTGKAEAVEEMLAYAHETTHEKIIRGVAMGIALIEYGREEEADIVIEQLLHDKDPILRFGAMYTIALAYACTANNSAIQKLLHWAVSDVSDDVRRAAVTALGFVLANVPEQVPRVVALLAESYNPHVRYGAALAIGIACAGGTGDKARKEALTVLEPLLKDRVDFVRQGAFIGASMVLIQHNETSEPKLGTFRKLINDAMNVKSDTMTKFGVILAAGIVDAGGRNVTISMLSPSGHKKMAAIVGLALFPQFWSWYPLVHFISLSFTPTAVIGLNKKLEIPKPFTFLSKAPPSAFAYPPAIDLTVKEEKKQVKIATLSITAKVKAKAKRKEEEAAAAAQMQVDEAGTTKQEEKGSETAATTDSTTPAVPVNPDDKMEVDVSTTSVAAGLKRQDSSSSEIGEEEKKSSSSSSSSDSKSVDAKKEEKKPELPFQILSNPARVTRSQFSHLDWPRSQRYRPVKEKLSGVVILSDSKPEEKEEIVKSKAPKIGVAGVSDDEPEPPAPFTYEG